MAPATVPTPRVVPAIPAPGIIPGTPVIPGIPGVHAKGVEANAGVVPENIIFNSTKTGITNLLAQSPILQIAVVIAKPIIFITVCFHISIHLT